MSLCELDRDALSQVLASLDAKTLANLRAVCQALSQLPVPVSPVQMEHVKRLLAILAVSRFALDLSMLGSGKTFTAARLAQEIGMKHTVVIAPCIVKPKWYQMKKMYGIALTMALSFGELASVVDRQPRHGLLRRCDDPAEDSPAKFVATPLLRRMIAEGVLFVMDEVQEIKNPNNHHMACRALVAEVLRAPEGSSSRVLFVSGSPVDKQKQVIGMLQCLGVLTQRLCIYQPFAHAFQYPGVTEVENFCRRFAGQQAVQAARLAHYGRWFYTYGDNAACKRWVYHLFQKTLKPCVSHAMPPPVLSHRMLCRNGFFNIAVEDRDRLEAGIRWLTNQSRFDPVTQSVTHTHSTGPAMGRINKALQEIEAAKVRTLARLATQALQGHPGAKVALCVNYDVGVDGLRRELGAYSPLVVNGKVNDKERDQAIRLFQRPSLERRVLICNAKVCSSGIDLDDKHGQFPRTVFISPMYNTITLYQLTYRFLRMDTRSDVGIYLVYGKNAVEKDVMRALGKKASVMKETTREQADHGVLFPGDYQGYIEPDGVDGATGVDAHTGAADAAGAAGDTGNAGDDGVDGNTGAAEPMMLG